MEVIKIKVATDKEFEENYWRFQPEKIIEEASRIFYKNFRVNLEMSDEEIDWQSPLTKNPGEIIPYLRGKNLEEILEDLKTSVPQIQEEKLLKIKEDLENRLKKAKDPHVYLQGYLQGFLDTVIGDFLFGSLKKIRKRPKEILWGISGKIVVLKWVGVKGYCRLGRAYSEMRIILTILCHHPLNAFLHELGHLFGADHQKKTVMEESLTSRYLNFDWRNRRIIKANLNKFFNAESPD